MYTFEVEANFLIFNKYSLLHRNFTVKGMLYINCNSETMSDDKSFMGTNYSSICPNLMILGIFAHRVNLQGGNWVKTQNNHSYSADSNFQKIFRGILCNSSDIVSEFQRI